MAIAFNWAGPLDLGMAVVLALKAAGIWLPTPYHHFWAYLAPGEEISQYSPFLMVRAVSAFVMWVANEFLFWPYLVCWIHAPIIGADRTTLDVPKVHFICRHAMFIFGFKHTEFVDQVLFNLFDFFGSPWPVVCILMGLGILLGVLYRQGCTVAVRVVYVLIIPGMAFFGSGLGQTWEFYGIWGVMALFACSTGLGVLWKTWRKKSPGEPVSGSSVYCCCPRRCADDRARGTGVV